MPFRFRVPIYPIIDPGNRPDRSHVQLAEEVLAGGARLVQLRIKEGTTRNFVEVARAVKSLTDRYAASLIINDRSDIARLIGAAGVHLGQEDLKPTDARAYLGTNAIIGVSTHDPEQLREAIRTGVADYVAFGPIFATSSKANPDPVQGMARLHEVRRYCPLPLVAIGGIKRETVGDVIRAGADAVAVIAAIAQQPSPMQATRDLIAQARSAVLAAARSRPAPRRS